MLVVPRWGRRRCVWGRPTVLAVGLVLVAVVTSGAQSPASPGSLVAGRDPSASPVTGGVVLDDPAMSYAAQREAWQSPVWVVPPTTTVALAPGAVVAPAALAELPTGPLGIPGVVLLAYRAAADQLATSLPGCHLPWNLLAGIGRIESGHAAGGRVDAHGTTLGPILGPLLDGSNPGDGVVLDTDHGRYDGNATYDRAVGPMQFLPSTWEKYGADGNHDGVADPHNVYDAALGAGAYLCSGGLDVADPAQARTAVFRYNHSEAYVTNVLTWSAAYALGVAPTDSAPGPVPTPLDHPSPSPTAPTTATAPATTAAAPATTTRTPASTTRTPVSTTLGTPTTTKAPTSTPTGTPTTTPVPFSPIPLMTTPPTSAP